MGRPAKKHDEWDKALEWAKEGHKVALACVYHTWGSSPRPVGSLLSIRQDGLFEGSVSGGCVEGAVITEAQDILKSGKTSVLEFGISNNQAWDVGLACGGKISILVAPLAKDEIPLLEVLASLRHRRTPAVLATRFSDGAKALFHDGQWLPGDDVWQGLSAQADETLETGSPALIEEDEKVFLNTLMPARRMFIVGAVHISQSLVPMAQMAGYEVTLIDPRGAFTEDSRFPGTDVIEDWPDEVLKNLDNRSAVITLTHDPKLDEAALSVALKSDCFYIGSLGSRKTHQARLQNLKSAGFKDSELLRIFGPIGLPIGAKTPAEIAVAILAQVTEASRKPVTK